MDKIKVYDFIENIEMFYAFLKYSKDQFFEKYPYLTQEEYDLTLSVFNKTLGVNNSSSCIIPL